MLKTPVKLKRNVILTLIGLILILFTLHFTMEAKGRAILIRSFEKKSLSKLDLYHEGVSRLTTQIINDRLDAIELIANSKTIKDALEGKNYAEATVFLENFKGKVFDNLFIINRQGKMVAIVDLSEEDEKQVLETDYSNRDYLTVSVGSGKPHISNVFFSTTNHYVIAISHPVFDRNGDVEYIVAGSLRLENMNKNFRFETNFDNFYSKMIDKQGNLITDGKNKVKIPQNLKAEDTFIADFIASPSEKFGETTDGNNNKTYLKASILPFRGGNSIYLISYFPLSEFSRESSELDQELRTGFLLIAGLSILLFTFGWLKTYRDVLQYGK